MNNLEKQPNENSAQTGWENTPLFSPHVMTQTSNNVVPQVSNPSPQNPLNVEPSFILKSSDEKSGTENFASPTIEYPNSAAPSNVEPPQEKNVAPTNLENLKSKKSSSKKSAKKKPRSQKRNVVPLKFFSSLEEKAGLEIKAKKEGLSLSNYIRVNVGLPPNILGRKKPGNILSIDLGLDSELE